MLYVSNMTDRLVEAVLEEGAQAYGCKRRLISDIIPVMKYCSKLVFLFPHSGNETKRSVYFHHSTRIALRVQRKVGYESIRRNLILRIS